MMKHTVVNSLDVKHWEKERRNLRSYFNSYAVYKVP